MAQTSSRNQDRNFSVHFDGAPIKTNGSMVQRKGGGIRGRKALNDISNSGKPSALQVARKHNLMNVIPIGEDLGASRKSQASVGAKAKNVSKVQVGSRKALGDLTNSVKPFGPQQDLKKKPISVVEEGNLPNSIAEERFLHNHQECVESQSRALDLRQFLKTIGLDEDVSMPSSRKSKVNESPMKLFEITELPEMIIEDKTELLLSRESSPVCRSPKSVWLPSMNEDYDSFILADSP